MSIRCKYRPTETKYMKNTWIHGRDHGLRVRERGRERERIRSWHIFVTRRSAHVTSLAGDVNFVMLFLQVKRIHLFGGSAHVATTECMVLHGDTKMFRTKCTQVMDQMWSTIDLKNECSAVMPDVCQEVTWRHWKRAVLRRGAG